MLIKWQKEVPAVYKGYILCCMCLKTEVIKNNQLQVNTPLQGVPRAYCKLL